MTEPSTDLTRKLSAAVEKMPAFPKSVQRILELTRDINCKPKELVMVIEKDPVMTIKLLRVLNSAYYSFPNPITSVHQSVVYLGINTIKNMALSFATAGVLPPHNDAGFDIQRYLAHSLTTASIARMLCQKYGGDGADPADCHIAGLLHDFGKVVFAQFMAAEFKEALALSAEQNCSLHATEQQVIGADHSVVGAMLVEKWQFPKQLSETIRHHHDGVSPDNAMLGCLYIADQISNRLSEEHDGSIVEDEIPPELVPCFGERLEEVMTGLGDLSRVIEEAELFARGGTEEAA